uniref:Protein kinase domain-containing protein n=1 Tax=Hyaloperonospora arabidopsidis (strain Emoy2) TaxID=559515 RepID=M4C218_HYAAE
MEITGDAGAARRPPRDKPLHQFTLNFLSTLNTINANYYRKHHPKPIDGSSSKKKKTKQQMKTPGPANYVFSTTGDETFHNGRYLVRGRKLGAGSFGQVVEAQDLVTNEAVAIKIVQKKQQYTDQAQIEINILQRLHRPRQLDATNHIGAF